MKSIENLKVGDKIFNRPITKITDKCIYINPTVPWGKSRYTKKEVKEFNERNN
jgi:hypothetical protein